MIAAQVDKPKKKGKGTIKGLTPAQVTGNAPRTPSEDVTQGTAIATPPPIPKTTTTTVTTPGTPPTADWWRSQYTTDPRFLLQDPVLRGQQNQTASNYGYVINRAPNGQAYYKTTGGATGITQSFDASGKPVYKDAAGNTYTADQLQLDIQRIAPGQAGYLEGALGNAEATSANQQQTIAESAALRGARRSGMRAQGSAAETQALQGALAGLTQRAAGELSGIDRQYADLYSSIFKDLAPQAEALSAPTTTTVETPVTPPAATTPPGPNPAEHMGTTTNRTISVGGQTVRIPGGINLDGVDTQAIGRRIAGNVAQVGGVGKLKPGQVVGQFRAGGKGYNVVYRNGAFVVVEAR